MSQSNLGYGLNLRKKTPFGQGAAARSSVAKPSGSSFAPISLKRNIKTNAAFQNDDDDDDEEEGDVAITELSSAPKSLRDAASISQSAAKTVNKELMAVYKQQEKIAEEAQRKAIELDATVFDYDTVYDQIKQERDRKKIESRGNSKKPIYMEAFFKAAAQRKLDREQAEERKVQKEREAEGEEFQDKEKFVTGAYKQKQEELRRLEEEERKREEAENKPATQEDMAEFYRHMLHQTARAAVMPSDSAKAVQPATGQPDSAASKIEDESNGDVERNERLKLAAAAGVAINDSDEVVDKRDLLFAGLNVSKKKLKAIEDERQQAIEARLEAEQKRQEELKIRKQEEERRRVAREQAARSRELLQKQKEEMEAEEKKRKEQERVEIREKLARKATEETVSDARARYLARRKQASKKSDDSGDSE